MRRIVRRASERGKGLKASIINTRNRALIGSYVNSARFSRRESSVGATLWGYRLSYEGFNSLMYTCSGLGRTQP